MKQPDFVQFQEKDSYLPETELESTISFNEVDDDLGIENLERKSKSHAMKKERRTYKKEDLQRIANMKTLIQFPVSPNLLNLLRDPAIEDHQFDQQFLSKVKSHMRAISQNHEYDAQILYFHLIISQIENLSSIQDQLDLQGNIIELNHQKWNNTNIMNTFCILQNLKNIECEKMAKEEQQFQIAIIEEKGVCLVHQSTLKISLQFIDIALRSYGHWDIYFAPFILEKLIADTTFRYLHLIQQNSALFINYSKIFVQISTEYASSLQLIQENWYDNQIEKIVKGQFLISDIQQLVHSGVRHTDLQKLLVGLLGEKDQSEKAVVLLNCYYNSNDWQINDASKPTICQCGEKFSINYLVENSKHRQQLIICLSAPCFNSKYNQYCFSFHKPTLNEYVADNISYLWIQNHFGKFKKTGFYDWILYFAYASGKQTVTKIIDIKQNKKLGSQIFSKNFLNLRNVKGRYIIHPQRSRQMQIHQIFIDSISSDQGQYKIPHFSDAIREIQILKNNGVNTIYISGVFERDCGQFDQGYKRPQASSTAFTNRCKPSSMLGGQKQFKKLLHYAKSNNIKVIVDAMARVSSSHMSKIYQPFKLSFIDQNGRKNYFYGSQGRSISYEQTCVLNYRKKQTWDIFLKEILYLVQHFGIDGIQLDNGSACPQIFEVDKQQMKRKEDGKLVYSYKEIFEGQIINIKKKSGYWSTKMAATYPNPFFVYLCQQIWRKYPNFIFISECYDSESSLRFVKSIQSGFIPRLFKLPKALSQVIGTQIHENGTLSEGTPKSATKLAKWYQETKRILPRNSILIQSTSNHVYPYPSLVFKKATWAVVDLFFFLPEIPMTFCKEHLGRAYRTKALNFFVDNQSSSESKHVSSPSQIGMAKTTSYSIANSTFFQQQSKTNRKDKNMLYSNISLRDPSQVKHLQASFRKEVGPEFGFDLAQIHKHYQHRRQLREKYPLLTTYRMLSLTAEHLYGIHTNVISFAKYGEDQILLISTNFNETAVDMHYNLTSLKSLFKSTSLSDIIVKIEDILNPQKFIDQYYTVGELITSKIEQNIKAFSSSIWRLSIIKDEKLIDKAYACSEQRMKEKVTRSPPQWIYSSVFTNQLDRLIQGCKTLKPFAEGLQILYDKFIAPSHLDLSLVISKTHQFYVHKVKLQKLFGILKLLQSNENKPYFDLFEPTLKSYVQKLLKGNQLGPIAFVTPQIGPWSSVGGLGVMVDELSKELVKLGQTVYIITPYYQYNKKKETDYLARDGFVYQKNIKVHAAHFSYELGIHRGVYHGVNYIWCHNPDLFSRPYEGQGASYVTKQLVFFALMALQACCQLQIFPSIMVTNDWMCGFVSAYVKVYKYKDIFNGTKFIHICHNLDPLYEGRLYPKFQEGDLNWLIQLPREWYLEYINNKMVINPSKCALETCDNWGTVSNSYKIDLLKQSDLADVLWKHPHPFSFPNGVRKDERLSIINAKTPGNHLDSKAMLQKKYFAFENINNDIPLFSFIGRVTKQKGVHLILDAVEALLYQTQFKVQFLIGGPSDSKQDYGKYCAQRMKYLTHKYPQCVWSNPDAFFTDGSLVNIGSDFAMMPSLFEPGGIVQHQFFCGSTPVVAFRTGGLKDTVFEFDPKTKKGNGFNFMSYDVEDFKRCLRRAINCYKNKQIYAKLRQNAFESVVEESDVARGWNSEFYRMQNKIYIDWDRVEEQTKSFKKKEQSKEKQVEVLSLSKGEYWKKDWQIKSGFKQVLKGASRLQGKLHHFCFETDKIPRPNQIMVCGTWNDWKQPSKMNFDKIHKNWKVSIKLKPGTYYYKYIMDGEWTLTKNEAIQTDLHNIDNHIAVIE